MNETPIILIADDAPDMVNQLKLVLKPILNRIELLVATDGLQAIQLCEQRKPNMLLLDHGMPGIDGFTACQVIRKIISNPDLAIWFITGLVQNEDESVAIEAGADCLITKPIDIQNLREKIIRHLKMETDDNIDLQNPTDVDDRNQTAA
ncbi:MAG: response regulator [Phycisphaeraceae bacterium]|nr:response regulator [Phycisphaeraceae bacterium]